MTTAEQEKDLQVSFHAKDEDGYVQVDFRDQNTDPEADPDFWIAFSDPKSIDMVILVLMLAKKQLTGTPQELATLEHVVTQEWVNTQLSRAPEAAAAVTFPGHACHQLLMIASDALAKKAETQQCEVLGFDCRDDGFYLKVTPEIGIYRGMKLREIPKKAGPCPT